MPDDYGPFASLVPQKADAAPDYGPFASLVPDKSPSLVDRASSSVAGVASDLGSDFAAGSDKLGINLLAAGTGAGIISPQAFAQHYADVAQAQKDRPADPDRQASLDALQGAAHDFVSSVKGGDIGGAAKSVADFGSTIANHPYDTLVRSGVEGLPGMVPWAAGAQAGAVAGGAAAAPVAAAAAATGAGAPLAPVIEAAGAIGGAATGVFAANAPVNYGDWLNQQITKELATRNLDPTKPQDVEQVVTDPAFMDQAKSQAMKFGMTSAAIDGLTSMLGGRFGKSIIGQTADVTAQTAGLTAADVGGEAAATGQAPDAGKVAQKFITSLPAMAAAHASMSNLHGATADDVRANWGIGQGAQEGGPDIRPDGESPTEAASAEPELPSTGTVNPGIRETAQANITEPTQGDVDSPIPTDLIQAGKAALADQEATGHANKVLSDAGMPAVNSPVHVDLGDGNLLPGTVTDAFSAQHPITGEALPGVHVTLDDGRKITETAQTLQNLGVKILPRDIEAEQQAQRQQAAPPAPATTYGDNFRMGGDLGLISDIHTAEPYVPVVEGQFDQQPHPPAPQAVNADPMLALPHPGAAPAGREVDGPGFTMGDQQVGAPLARALYHVNQLDAGTSISSPALAQAVGLKPIQAAQLMTVLSNRGAVRFDGKGWVRTGGPAQDAAQPITDAATATPVATDAIPTQTGSLTALAKRMPPPKAERNVLDFISKRGGMTDAGGELRGQDLHLWHLKRPGWGRLIRPQDAPSKDSLDRSPDGTLTAAKEAGYLREDSGLPDLYHAIDSAARNIGQGGRKLDGSQEPEGAESPIDVPALLAESVKNYAVHNGHMIGDGALTDAELARAAQLRLDHGMNDEEAIDHARDETAIAWADERYKDRNDADQTQAIPFDTGSTGVRRRDQGGRSDQADVGGTQGGGPADRGRLGALGEHQGTPEEAALDLRGKTVGDAIGAAPETDEQATPRRQAEARDLIDLKANQTKLGRTDQESLKDQEGGLFSSDRDQDSLFQRTSSPEPPTGKMENLQRGRDAIERVLQGRDAPYAMYRKDTGWIDFLHGDARAGIDHLIMQRMDKDGMSQEEAESFVRKLPDIISNGRLTAYYETRAGDIGKNINGLGSTVSLRFVRQGNRQNWVITGFEGSKMIPEGARLVSVSYAEKKIADAVTPGFRLRRDATQDGHQSGTAQQVSGRSGEPESDPAQGQSRPNLGAADGTVTDASAEGKETPGDDTSHERSIGGLRLNYRRPTTTRLEGGGIAYSDPSTIGTRAAAEQHLSDLLSGIVGPHATGIHVVDDIITADGGDITGSFEQRGHEIYISMRGLDEMASTARHEAVHLLRAAGAFSKTEWSILSSAAEREWRGQYGIDKAYEPDVEAWRARGLSDDQIDEKLNEEAIAFAAADPANREAQKGIIARALDKVRRFLEGLRNFIKGRGFKTAKDVLGDFEGGRMSDRSEAREDAGSSYARSPISAATIKTAKDAADRAKATAAHLDHAIEASRLGDKYKTVKETVERAKDLIGSGLDEYRMFATPMSVSNATPEARAAAKDFANALRKSHWQTGQYDNKLRLQFSADERKTMWETLDQASVVAQKAMQGGATRFEALQEGRKVLAGLPARQRAVVDELTQYAEGLWQKAKDAEMVQGDGLPLWTPRMAVMIGEDGEFQPLKGEGKDGQGAPTLDRLGGNLNTRSANMNHRSHLEADETESAMQGVNKTAQLVRDIRVMPLAMGRLERAIAGRELVNSIESIGKATGMATTSAGDAEGYFTLPHPALTTYRPRTEEVPVSADQLSERDLHVIDGEVFKPVPGGAPKPLSSYNVDSKGNVTQWRNVEDANGKPVFDRQPIYIHKSFEGPLRAVLSSKSGLFYQAAMNLKANAMGMIMFSPMIHNMVEFGRALPKMLPGMGSSFRVYSDGARALADPDAMPELIDGGLAPIGSRGFMQDITGIQQDPLLIPGHSLISRGIGGTVGLLNKVAGEKVKEGIDAAGEFWHNKLLWEQIAKLQAGLAVNMRDHYIGQGFPRPVAVMMAAHEANRYAGALPKEAMGQLATRLANVLMFSRTFTFGNLGVLRDMFAGLPPDIQAKIRLEFGADMQKKASNKIKAEAVKTVALDLALSMIGAALLQASINAIMGGKNTDQEKDLARRWQHATSLSFPGMIKSIFWDNALSPTADNEPGREAKVKVGHEKDGTAIYTKNPVGKIGEEFHNWIAHPIDTAGNKVAPLAKGIWEDVVNDKGYGPGHPADPVWNANDNILKIAGAMAWHIIEGQENAPVLGSLKNIGGAIASGQAPDMRDVEKVGGPLVGLQISHGARGGEALGEYYAAKDRHEADVALALPDIKDMIQKGDTDGAIDRMISLGMDKTEIKARLRSQQDPGMTASKLKAFEQFATPDEKARMESALEKQ